MQATNHLDEQTASELMFRIADERDRTAFSRLFRFMAPKVKGFFMTGHPLTREMADELTQEVMWKIWDKAPHYKAEKAMLMTWVYTIAKNIRIDWLRQQQRHQKIYLKAEELESETITGDLPYIALQERRNRQTINESLEGLPDEQIQIIRMIFMEGKSHSEIASELAMPLGTVKSRLRLALEKLKSIQAE